MSCTTILVGKLATNDGSTIVARTEDTPNGTFGVKKLVVVQPKDQPRRYTSIGSGLTVELPDDPLRYMCVPNADPADGVWAEAGINAANVSMSATETITSNARVLGADPLVCYQPAVGTEGEPGYEKSVPGGLGEEDFVTVVLPYIHSAREGVRRLGDLIAEYGTSEMNGIAFGDAEEVWYMETIGGHHWIARRVPDECYVAQPNRQGIDRMDLRDALGPQKDFMCSDDLPEWMHANQLGVTSSDLLESIHGIPVVFNPRTAFTSWTWLDSIYNNPRAWSIINAFNPYNDDAVPEAIEDMLQPWCMKPELRLSVLDVNRALSSTYEGTPYNPYGNKGTESERHRYRPIGINRTAECSILQIRGQAPKAVQGVQWLSYGSGPFACCLALFAGVSKVPAYLNTDAGTVSTAQLYWAERLIAAMADCEYFENLEDISRCRQLVMSRGYEHLHKADAIAGRPETDESELTAVLEKFNQQLADYTQQQVNQLLADVLHKRSLHMKNAFGASDA
ncbi:MAG: C69 family dipeptidase [Clostridia bacterium]|nr:C69 family dipeptidase [Clostridia bacterium]